MAAISMMPSGTRKLTIQVMTRFRVTGIVEGTLCISSGVSGPDGGLVFNECGISGHSVLDNRVEHRGGVINLNGQTALFSGDGQQSFDVFGGIRVLRFVSSGRPHSNWARVSNRKSNDAAILASHEGLLGSGARG